MVWGVMSVVIWRVISLLYHVGPWNNIQVVRVDSKPIYPLSQLLALYFIFKKSILPVLYLISLHIL